ncbi:MAG TPA: hypothetical protein VEX11_08795 [Acetobacteraceae bacterium]|nr:hypothetical protein [Acetobacteraceae bacterium]
MAKEKTHHATDDRTTSRGTVKGHHEDPDAKIPEGGEAAASTDSPGAPKASASKASDEGVDRGDGASTATVGKREKQQAEAANAGKPQSERR